MAHNEEGKREYEISYLAKGEQGASVMDGFLKRFGGEVVQAEEPKRIALAYPIKKETAAFFGVIRAQIDPSMLKELRKELELEGEILRFIFVNEPIRQSMRRERDDREPAREEGEEVRSEEEPKKQAKTEKGDRAVTNEELEKKLQEILQ